MRAANAVLCQTPALQPRTCITAAGMVPGLISSRTRLKSRVLSSKSVSHSREEHSRASLGYILGIAALTRLVLPLAVCCIVEPDRLSAQRERGAREHPSREKKALLSLDCFKERGKRQKRHVHVVARLLEHRLRIATCWALANFNALVVACGRPC